MTSIAHWRKELSRQVSKGFIGINPVSPPKADFTWERIPVARVRTASGARYDARCHESIAAGTNFCDRNPNQGTHTAGRFPAGPGALSISRIFCASGEVIGCH